MPVSVRYEAVILDAGGVLVLPDPDPVIEICATYGVVATPETTERAHYVGIRALDAGVAPEPDGRAYLAAYAGVLGIPGPARRPALRALARLFATPGFWRCAIEASRAALRRLSQAGVPLAVVSNSDGSVEPTLRELGICQTGPGAGVEVAVVIDSSVVGVEKPDPAIFRPALDALGLAPEGCLYVGDSVRNDVRGAAAAGLTPVLLDPHVTATAAEAPHRIRHLGELVGAARS